MNSDVLFAVNVAQNCRGVAFSKDDGLNAKMAKFQFFSTLPLFSKQMTKI